MEPLLIINPSAGRLRDEPRLRLRLSDHPLLAGGEVHLPATAEDARILARQGAEAGFDPIIAAGGDGTVHAVVNGLMDVDGDAHPTLAVVPLGTANDFARTLDLPTDPEEALSLIAEGGPRPLDLIRARIDEGPIRHAVNAVTGGFTAEAEEELITEAKESWGPLAYLRTGLGALPDPSDYQATIWADDGEPREVSLLSLVVANGRFAGGGIPVGPGAALDDGLLDVTLVPHLALGEIASVAAAILRGDHRESEEVTTFRARRIRLTCEPPIWLSLDGELARAGKARFRVAPGALSVVGPRPAP